MIDARQGPAGHQTLFANPAAAYLHAHFASPGCYAARVECA